MDNPFYISAYKSPKYFCDREKEANALRLALENGRNTVLLSLRRMGKTGLIKHLFHTLQSDKGVYLFYFDIMNTHSTKEFVDLMAGAVLGVFSSKTKRLFENVMKFFTRFSPVITYDSVTGVPSISLKLNTEEQVQNSFIAILKYLEGQKQHVYIAIDEFQQIVNYENSAFEGFLRSHIQHLNNVNFIFSGSQQYILLNMFGSYSRPFYQSSDFLKLERIPKDIYLEFIIEKFRDTKKNISKEAVSDILEWLDLYTYYIQSFFNKLWYNSGSNIDEKTIEETKQLLLDELDFIYSNMNNMLTKTQYNLLIAIAKNDGVEKPTSKAFIDQNGLGTTSTVNSAIKTLVDKELVYKENKSYKVYDLFFAKWAERKFL